MNTDELKSHFDKGMRKRIDPLSVGNGNITQGSMCFGYEEDEQFFSLVGFAEMTALRQPSDNTTSVQMMEDSDAVTIASKSSIKFEHDKIVKLKPETLADAMAGGVVRDMLDVGIVCLQGALAQNVDVAPDVLNADFLHDNTKLSWIAHSTSLSDLISRMFRPTDFLKKNLYSFDNVGFIRELALKPIIVRDSHALEVNNGREISMYRTIGLSKGGLAVFVDKADFDTTRSDTCQLTWRVRVAVRGFRWQGDKKPINDITKLCEPSNWQAKTEEKDRWAGIILERALPSASKQANAG